MQPAKNIQCAGRHLLFFDPVANVAAKFAGDSRQQTKAIDARPPALIESLSERLYIPFDSDAFRSASDVSTVQRRQRKSFPKTLLQAPEFCLRVRQGGGQIPRDLGP
jgi:hypothetical protein